MSRTIVICNFEKPAHGGRRELIASHGIVESTGLAVTVPSVSPQELGARLDPTINEYVMDDVEDAPRPS